MRRVIRPAAETMMLYGLLGWLYIALWAALRPDELSVPVTALIPMRRDTFGALCFAGSAIAAAGLQVGTGRFLPGCRCSRAAADAVLRTVALYALLAWIYLCVNSFTHPYTLGIGLTHFASEPTEGTTATLCFPLSAAAFAVLRLRASGSTAGL